MTTHSAIEKTLRAKLDELVRRVASIEADLREPLDPDTEEQAIDLEDDETLQALENAGRGEVARVRAALARIEQGTYGVCPTCGEEIAPARLTALPTAIQCADCATKATSRQ